MTYQKLQVAKSIDVIKSDTINIPNPNVATSGTANATTASKLRNSAGLFLTSGVKIGDVVYNTTDNTIATITALDSEIALSISADIFVSGEAYVIYQTENPNAGCVLYVGVGGIVKVRTAGGSDATLVNVPNGSFLPINIVKVYSATTTATNMIAFW